LLRGRLELIPCPLLLPVAAFGVVVLAQYATRATAYLYATRLSLMTGVAVAALFFVASQTLSSRAHVRQFTAIMAVFGFAVSVLAVVQHFSSPERIYWAIQPPDAGLVFGPYVNRNHFAGCIEMLFPLALLRAFDVQYVRGKRVLWAFMATMMVVSIVISQSRAGCVVALLELIFVAVLLRTGKKNRRLVVGLLAVFFLVAVAISLWLTNGRALERFSQVHDLRFRIAKDTVRMLPQHPWIGWGAGTYESVYPPFRSYVSPFVVDHAHNDYLEALVETGICGFSMVVLFVVMLYRTAWQSLASRTWSPTGPRAAALIGCTGLLIHSFTDFNMHIPANAALFFVLAAVVVQRSSAKYTGSQRQIFWELKG
jgi:O-antigen ligase